MRRSFLAIVLCAAIATTPARAIIVFDPTNFSANIQSAIHDVIQVSQQVTMISNQVQQIIALEKSVANGNFSNAFALLGQIDNTVNLLSSAEGLANTVMNLDQMYQDVFQANWADSAANTITWNDGTTSSVGGGGHPAAPKPAEGSQITWNDGTTSKVGANGRDQNGFEIKWNDGSSTYVRQATEETWSTQIHGALRAAMNLQSAFGETMQAHRGNLSGAMQASRLASGTTAAAQATNELLGIVSNQLGSMQQTMVSHQRAVEAQLATDTASQDKARTLRPEFLRFKPVETDPVAVQNDFRSVTGTVTTVR